MAENEKKIASLADLKESRGGDGTVITLKQASAKAGMDINIRVRPLQPMEFVKAANFPIDEINAVLHGEIEEVEFQSSFKEHTDAMDYTETMDTAAATVEIATIEPEIPTGEARKILGDLDVMQAFVAIRHLTVPAKGVEAAATFREDG